MEMKQEEKKKRFCLIRTMYVCVSRSMHLEAVLDKVEVFSMTSTCFSVVLQQNEQLLGEVVSILLHSRKWKFQDPHESLKRLSDHLHTPKHTTHTNRVVLHIKHAETLYTNSV